MPYKFIRTSELTDQFQENHPGNSSRLWLDILNDAVNQVVSNGGQVVSVGYDPMGEPMTILFDVATDAPG
ncbi:hypothetical protein AB0E63_22715 [Kribbella sp. NPDC026596]|uniref:hypothetical protein n=1 Tax=Kribbella sp. NPDC026596 TaxID=3155122 RepID=UPI0033CCE8B8